MQSKQTTSPDLTFEDLKNNRFLEMMSLSMEDIWSMNQEEKEQLRKDVDTLRKYLTNYNLSKHRLTFTELFLSSTRGKVGAINEKLRKLGY